MKQVLLAFVLFVVPYFVDAKIYILPSGLEYVVPETIKITKRFTLPSGIFWWAEVHVANAAELELKDQIRFWIMSIAQEYGVEADEMYNLAICESKDKDGNPDPKAKGDYRSETGEWMAVNIYQWWRSSWNHYNKIYGTKLDRHSWRDQTVMTAKVLRDGEWRNWTNCWKWIHSKNWKWKYVN